MKYITILGSDPGKNNSAFSIVKVMIDPPFRYAVAETGMVKNVIRDLTVDPMRQSKAYRAETLELIKRHEVDVITVERFQNRGRFSGNTGELVSMMIGVMYGLPVLDVKVITAAQWKNAANKVGDLAQIYEESTLVAHRVDATSIALYGASQYLMLPPFEFLKGDGQQKYVRRLNKTG